jgi:hypothetical protein
MKRDVPKALKTAGFIGAAFCAGAGTMYLLDPDRGRSRRAKIRDKAYHYLRESEHIVEKAGRDFRNRTIGTLHEAKTMLLREDVADIKLIERVRSKLGRLVSHPHAIVVSAENGCITVEGPIRAEEVQRTLNCIRKIEGVKSIDNRLEPHDGADRHPALEGGRPRRGERLAIFQSSWAPAVRMGASMIGTGAALYGLLSHKKIGRAGAVLGLGLLARAITNRDVSALKELIRS